MIRTLTGLLSMILFGVVIPAGASGLAEGPRRAGEIVSEPMTLTTAETGAVVFEVGTLYVPENRNDPKSRVIGVGFARFRALQASGAPPTFHLPGGPGLGVVLDEQKLGRYRFAAKTVS